MKFDTDSFRLRSEQTTDIVYNAMRYRGYRIEPVDEGKHYSHKVNGMRADLHINQGYWKDPIQITMSDAQKARFEWKPYETAELICLARYWEGQDRGADGSEEVSGHSFILFHRDIRIGFMKDFWEPPEGYPNANWKKLDLKDCLHPTMTEHYVDFIEDAWYTGVPPQKVAESIIALREAVALPIERSHENG